MFRWGSLHLGPAPPCRTGESCHDLYCPSRSALHPVISWGCSIDLKMLRSCGRRRGLNLAKPVRCLTTISYRCLFQGNLPGRGNCWVWLLAWFWGDGRSCSAHQTAVRLDAAVGLLVLAGPGWPALRSRHTRSALFGRIGSSARHRHDPSWCSSFQGDAWPWVRNAGLTSLGGRPPLWGKWHPVPRCWCACPCSNLGLTQPRHSCSLSLRPMMAALASHRWSRWGSRGFVAEFRAAACWPAALSHLEGSPANATFVHATSPLIAMITVFVINEPFWFLWLAHSGMSASSRLTQGGWVTELAWQSARTAATRDGFSTPPGTPGV